MQILSVRCKRYRRHANIPQPTHATPTWSVSSGDRGGAGGSRVLENGALDLWPRSDDANVGRILDGDDRASGENQLLPSLAQIDDVL